MRDVAAAVFDPALEVLVAPRIGVLHRLCNGGMEAIQRDKFFGDPLFVVQCQRGRCVEQSFDCIEVKAPLCGLLVGDPAFLQLV
ncbi:hypothetical protein D3C71_1620380 [compost metagenome]